MQMVKIIILQITPTDGGKGVSATQQIVRWKSIDQYYRCLHKSSKHVPGALVLELPDGSRTSSTKDRSYGFVPRSGHKRVPIATLFGRLQHIFASDSSGMQGGRPGNQPLAPSPPPLHLFSLVELRGAIKYGPGVTSSAGFLGDLASVRRWTSLDFPGGLFA